MDTRSQIISHVDAVSTAAEFRLDTKDNHPPTSNWRLSWRLQPWLPVILISQFERWNSLHSTSMFPAVQKGTKPSAVSTQTSQRPAEPDSVTTDGHMHQSEAPGEVGGAGAGVQSKPEEGRSQGQAQLQAKVDVRHGSPPPPPPPPPAPSRPSLPHAHTCKLYGLIRHTTFTTHGTRLSLKLLLHRCENMSLA